MKENMKENWTVIFENNTVGYVLAEKIGYLWELYMPDDETLIKRGRTLSFLKAIEKCNALAFSITDDIDKWSRI